MDGKYDVCFSVVWFLIISYLYIGTNTVLYRNRGQYAAEHNRQFVD